LTGEQNTVVELLLCVTAKVRETTSDDPKLSSSAVPASVRHAANKST